jgi:hypothetical protein
MPSESHGVPQPEMLARPCRGLQSTGRFGRLRRTQYIPSENPSLSIPSAQLTARVDVVEPIRGAPHGERAQILLGQPGVDRRPRPEVQAAIRRGVELLAQALS